MATAVAMTRRGLVKAVSSALALLLVPPLSGVRRAGAGSGRVAADPSAEAGELPLEGTWTEPESPALMQVMCAHCAAYSELGRISKRADAIAPGQAPAPADLKRLDALCDMERDLFMQLCRYPASNNAERQEKATYLLAFCDGDEFERQHIEALLKSMGAVESQPVEPEAQSS